MRSKFLIILLLFFFSCTPDTMPEPEGCNFPDNIEFELNLNEESLMYHGLFKFIEERKLKLYFGRENSESCRSFEEVIIGHFPFKLDDTVFLNMDTIYNLHAHTVDIDQIASNYKLFGEDNWVFVDEVSNDSTEVKGSARLNFEKIYGPNNLSDTLVFDCPNWGAKLWIE